MQAADASPVQACVVTPRKPRNDQLVRNGSHGRVLKPLEGVWETRRKPLGGEPEKLQSGSLGAFPASKKSK